MVNNSKCSCCGAESHPQLQRQLEKLDYASALAMVKSSTKKRKTYTDVCKQTLAMIRKNNGSNPYQPGFTAPTQSHPEETMIDMGGGWQILGTPLHLHEPRLLAIAEADHQFLEAEYDDYNATNASKPTFCRSAALIVSPRDHKP
ncbi:unnamed protein product [Ilex paraguariensis]|uniref:Uncharacterized protein n=1 Tax=Ilex paraguariensis TaxID=185542 RepID=A0ABC8TRV7_9AQUA